MANNRSSATMALARYLPLPIEITGPVIISGDETSLTVGLLAGLQVVRPGQPLLVVDGANAFDPFLVATLARKSGIAPKLVLDEIRISRVFTCHQFEALLRGRLQSSLKQFGGKAVLFSGLLDALLDEEVPLKEAIRIFNHIPPVLKGLAVEGVMALCVCPPLAVPLGRERFLATLNEAAVWTFKVTQQGEVVQITCTKPRPATWTWQPEIGMLAARRWS
ncbi:MAG TPA: hypothetical protein VGK88_13145 [bacterium]|jgi:hypothetical protein